MPEFSTGKALCFPLGSKIEIKKSCLFPEVEGLILRLLCKAGTVHGLRGVIGNDLNGQEVLNELAKEGVEIKYFQKHEDDFTAYSIILVEASGEGPSCRIKARVSILMLIKLL